ncbi:MAG: hypothetical protein FWC42_00485 [Proteobacteria bacterium]|nr:hypothetical protein [Pseudomonadota bacterium]
MKIKLTVFSFLLLTGWSALALATDTSRPATPEETQAITDMLKSTLDSAKVSDARISANGKMACGFVNARIFTMRLDKNGKPTPLGLGIGTDRRDTAVSAECQKAGITLPQ